MQDDELFEEIEKAIQDPDLREKIILILEEAELLP